MTPTDSTRPEGATGTSGVDVDCFGFPVSAPTCLIRVPEPCCPILRDEERKMCLPIGLQGGATIELAAFCQTIHKCELCPKVVLAVSAPTC